MRQVPFEVLMHAENALSESECAMSVLSMWIDSIPDGNEHRESALKQLWCWPLNSGTANA